MGRRDRDRDRDPRDPRRGGLIRLGIRGLAGGVGLISESIKAHKDSKKEQAEGQEIGIAVPGERANASFAAQSSGAQETGIAVPDERANAPFAAQSSGAPPSYDQVAESGSSQQAPVDKKASEKTHDDDAGQPDDNLEEEWTLDDAQDEMIDETAEVKAPKKTARELEDEFIANHPAPPPGALRGHLPLPVVIPQRRPKDRSRGFIRAYAPVLENCGIDQTTWLTFLDTFQKSSAANPWLNAINMAQFAAIAIPHGIGIAVGIAIQLITNAMIELQSRER
jgi:hypothetical protein